MNNQTSTKTKTIELLDGFTDKEGNVHRKITFGRRVTVRDIWDLEANPQSGVRTQYNDLFIRRMITKFGELPMPPLLNVLLSLNKYDREDLTEASDAFLRESRGDAKADFIGEDTVKLYFGFEIGGAVYDVVKFGNILTGNDAVDADEFGEATRRNCFELSREICELSSSETPGLKLTGTVALAAFEDLDSDDYTVLAAAANKWRQTFRLKRKALQIERNRASRVSPATGIAATGSGDSADAGNQDSNVSGDDAAAS